jgi:TP901 family phage tail tape measure protein
MAFSVSYIYEVVDRYTRPLSKIRKVTDKFTGAAKKAQHATKSFSNKMAGMQSTAASLGGVIGGAALIGQFTSFESSINKLNAVTLASANDMARLRGTAKRLGAETQFSASQAAQGMTFLAMAGLDTEGILKAIPGTLQLAAAGGMDLASAADIATNVLAQMGLEVEELTRVNDVLALVQARANTDVFQAAEAMKNVGTSASTLGITIEQLTALIGAMANSGVKGGEAGTLLRNAMLRLVNPSRKALKTFRALRINLQDFITPDGKIKNFTGLIKLLNDRGASTAQIFNIFEERGGRAIQALQKQGKPAIDALTASLAKAGGTAERMAGIQMKGLPGVLKAAASAFEALNIAIFETGLDQFLINVVGGFTKFVRWLSKTHPWILKIIAVLGSFLAIAGPILMAVGLISAGVSAMAGVFAAAGVVIGAISLPIVLIIAGIGVLITAIVLLVKHWDKVTAAMNHFFVFINNRVASAFKEVILGPITIFIGKIKELIGLIENRAFKFFIDKFEKIKGFFGGAKDINLNINQNQGGVKDIDLNINQNQGGVAASNAAMSGTLNGNIAVSATNGASIEKASLASSMPGNLGFNMAEAGGF